VLHFAGNDLLGDIVFLNPIWATGIIYRVLNAEVEAAHGRFTKAQLTDEWHDIIPDTYSGAFRFRDEKEVAIFLELMKAFEICFELPGQPGAYSAPQFLPRDEPPLDWDSANALKFGYEYTFLHKGLIARAIVRLSEYARDQSYWKEGMLIEHAATRALIRADYARRQLRIELQGANPAGLRDFVIDKVFKDVNQDLQAREIVFCPRCDGAIEAGVAAALYAQKEEKILCPQCRQNVPLAGIFELPKAAPAPRPDPRQIRALLSADELEQALRSIEPFAQTETVLWQARLKQADNDFRLGMILGGEYSKIRQQVIKAVLDWLEEVGP
jgi:hypothetical protein